LGIFLFVSDNQSVMAENGVLLPLQKLLMVKNNINYEEIHNWAGNIDFFFLLSCGFWIKYCSSLFIQTVHVSFDNQSKLVENGTPLPL
jgi:hypothetical protein